MKFLYRRYNELVLGTFIAPISPPTHFAPPLKWHKNSTLSLLTNGAQLLTSLVPCSHIYHGFGKSRQFHAWFRHGLVQIFQATALGGAICVTRITDLFDKESPNKNNDRDQSLIVSKEDWMVTSSLILRWNLKIISRSSVTVGSGTLPTVCKCSSLAAHTNRVAQAFGQL